MDLPLPQDVLYHITEQQNTFYTIYPELKAVTTEFKAVVLDAYGVFWAGNRAGLIPGAKQAMEELVKGGKIVLILSNATQRAQQEIDKLAKHGLIQGVHFHFLLTSGEVTRQLLCSGKFPTPTPHKKFYVFGSEHPGFTAYQSLFENTGFTETSQITEADFIYVPVPHINGEDQVDPECFRSQVLALGIHSIPMLCANPDRFAQEGLPPKIVVRQGSIAALYEELGGKAVYIGKPFAYMYTAAMDILSHFGIFSTKEILMVGDTPETDIRGARAFGMPSALLTRTGLTSARINKSDVNSCIQSLSPEDLPVFFVERLGIP